MRMVAIRNQSSVPKAYIEFDVDGRTKPGPLYDPGVDVCEELVNFTLPTRETNDEHTERYSERHDEGYPPSGVPHLAVIAEAR